MAPQFEAALHSVEGIEDVNSDLQIKNPQIDVELDREQIAALGLTVDQVESALTRRTARSRSRRSSRRTTSTR